MKGKDRLFESVIKEIFADVFSVKHGRFRANRFDPPCIARVYVVLSKSTIHATQEIRRVNQPWDFRVFRHVWISDSLYFLYLCESIDFERKANASERLLAGVFMPYEVGSHLRKPVEGVSCLF